MTRKPRISMVVAHGLHREIGGGNNLLWNLPGDLQRFKAVTMGHPIIMGRKTYESIGRPLPGRLNIVITRNPELQLDGVTVVSTIDEAIRIATDTDPDEIFIIGGGEIFEQTIGITDRIYLTIVKESFAGADVFFPEYPSFQPVGVAETGLDNNLPWEYQVWERSIK